MPNSNATRTEAGFRSNPWLALVGILLALVPVARGADDAMEVLKTRTASYTNVTVTAKNPANIYIKHDGGVANVKTRDLEPEALQYLGYAVAKKETNSTSSQMVNRVLESLPIKKLQQSADDLHIPRRVQDVHLDSPTLIGVLAGMLVCYLFFCYCCGLICRKSGSEPGILVWLPILQVFPLLRAAGMSGWWFLAFFVPGLNLVAEMAWCINIVLTRGKSLWWALFLVLPGTNLFVFLYLAFSGAKSVDDKPRLSLGAPGLARS